MHLDLVNGSVSTAVLTNRPTPVASCVCSIQVLILDVDGTLYGQSSGVEQQVCRHEQTCAATPKAVRNTTSAVDSDTHPRYSTAPFSPTT